MGGTDHLDARQLQAASRGGTGPFLPDQVALVLGANGLGVALVFAGWWAASGSASAADQLTWMNVSILGLLTAGAGNGVLLARARRTIVLARTSVLGTPPRRTASGRFAPGSSNGRFDARHAARPSIGQARATRTARANGTSLRDHLVAVPGTKRYHRVGCPMVAGKQVEIASAPDHHEADRGACEVCRP